ncbi:MAG: LacI family DNA-binding transcriptional regulator [Rhodospirillales bacterium]|nr:LacI family DNA-binding transcriptional regulator [Rhodospirillales bacterium]
MKTARPKARAKDVASAAGVSVATVSRTYNNPEVVREDARQRVLHAAKVLDYRPHPAAKALRLQRSHIVGAVIPTLDYAIYAHMINALQLALRDSGFSLFVATSGFDNAEVGAVATSLIDRGAEALLLVGVVDDDNFFYLAEMKQIPIVSTYSYREDFRVPFVGFDNFEATRRMTEYLLSLGHRNLAMITGPSRGNDRQQARMAAFQQALQDHGLSSPAPLIVEKQYAIAQGAEAARQILRDRPDTTAIVCNSDILAMGVLAECRRREIPVPGRLSVAGHDDHDIARFLDPPLTTVSVPADEMGRLAAESLLAALETQQPPGGFKLQTNLVIRESTAKCQASL